MIWSGDSWYFERFKPRSLDELHEKGQVWLPAVGERLKKSFLDDLDNHDVKLAVQNVTAPMLLIQPDNDDQVPRWVSEQAFALKQGPKEWFKVEGTHTLVTADGSDWSDVEEGVVVEKALEWFRSCLL